MVWDGHGLEGDLLGVLKEGVRSPDPVEPLDGEKLVLPRHVGRQPQSVIIPLLPKKYVSHVCLQVTGEIRSLEIID